LGINGKVPFVEILFLGAKHYILSCQLQNRKCCFGMVFANESAMKKFVLVLMVFFSLSFANQSFAATNANIAGPKDSTENCESSFFSWATVDHMVCYAKDFIGIPYRYGSMSLSAFDCSGFTSYVFKQFGLLLPRSARDQAILGHKIHECDARKGDLVFFKGRSTSSSFVGHVGIVVSEIGDKLTFIHASVHKGITIDTIDLRYYKDRFLYVKRLFDL
jgi:cell wall-associated NlpC family hydrolase